MRQLPQRRDRSSKAVQRSIERHSMLCLQIQPVKNVVRPAWLR